MCERSGKPECKHSTADAAALNRGVLQAIDEIGGRAALPVSAHRSALLRALPDLLCVRIARDKRRNMLCELRRTLSK
jgi:hypothetical protein